METTVLFKRRLFLILGLATFFFVGCSKEDSSDDDSSASVDAPKTIVGKSLIWKHNGYNDDTYTFNSNGTVTVNSVTGNALNATVSKSSYTYTPNSDGNASLTVKYTSTFKTGSITSTIVYNIEFILTFYKGNSGVYSAHESTTTTNTNKSGPFLLGKVGDVIVEESSPIAGSANCAQRQYIYNSMKKNLATTERLRDTAGSTTVRIMAGNQAAQIKRDMDKAKADAKKVGCSLL